MAIKTAFVIDDSRVARVILGRLLETEGLEVTEIESGDEALALLKHGARPDVIFMDMVMQGLSGVETTARIKSEIKLRDIPVVMCTGNEAATERQAALAAGASSILAKPPVKGELETVLMQFNRALEEGVIMSASTRQTDSKAKLDLDKDALMAEVSSKMDGKFERAAEAWMPVMKENVSNWIAQEQTDLDQRIATEVDEKSKVVGKEIAEKVVSDLATIRVEQAVTDANVAEKMDALLAEKTPEWLNIQQVRLENALLPLIEKKLMVSLTAEMATQIEQGMASEAMLQIKANVQEDVHAMLADIEKKTIKPLQMKVHGLMAVVVLLVLLMLIF